MPVKINGTTSGSVTLAAPDTGSDVSLTLPTTAIATESFVSSSYLPIAGGKILQIVTSSDTTQRTTTSLTYVDVTGMTLTITPQKNDSSVLIVATFQALASGSLTYGDFRITDSSGNAINSAEQSRVGVSASDTESPVAMIGYATPASTSAQTYKLMFRRVQGTLVQASNHLQTGRMYGIEVSA